MTHSFIEEKVYQLFHLVHQGELGTIVKIGTLLWAAPYQKAGKTQLFFVKFNEQLEVIGHLSIPMTYELWCFVGEQHI